MLTSDELPDSIKLKLYRKLVLKAISSKDQQKEENPEKIVYSKLADDKAVELMNKLKIKYPEIYRTIIDELYKAIKNNVISSIDGYTLYELFNALGLDIRPDVKIKIVKHGKEVDLTTHLKEQGSRG
ncbi:MAG: hypothetical protein QXV54_05040 [Desulfurococcaceae archaeon]